jgi:hypothetical protein
MHGNRFILEHRPLNAFVAPLEPVLVCSYFAEFEQKRDFGGASGTCFGK